jgi:hypothetical protein
MHDACPEFGSSCSVICDCVSADPGINCFFAAQIVDGRIQAHLFSKKMLVRHFMKNVGSTFLFEKYCDIFLKNVYNILYLIILRRDGWQINN